MYGNHKEEKKRRRKMSNLEGVRIEKFWKETGKTSSKDKV